MTSLLPSLPTIVALVKIGLLVGGLMTAAAYLVLVERWMAAWVQDRKGPNRVGIPLTKVRLFGLGQPLADGLKIILKEDFTPKHVDKVLYTAAPLVILAASLAIFATIPFGSSLPPIPALGLTGEEPLLVAPGLDVGVLWVFALSSIAVYGVLLGGWASNNKYGFLGGLRSSAQLVAYEIPLGLGLLGVVLAAGSLKLDTIMNAQADTGVWYAFAQPLGAALVLACAHAAKSAGISAGRCSLFDRRSGHRQQIAAVVNANLSHRLGVFWRRDLQHLVPHDIRQFQIIQDHVERRAQPNSAQAFGDWAVLRNAGFVQEPRVEHDGNRVFVREVKHHVLERHFDEIEFRRLFHFRFNPGLRRLSLSTAFRGCRSARRSRGTRPRRRLLLRSRGHCNSHHHQPANASHHPPLFRKNAPPHCRLSHRESNEHTHDLNR